MMDVDGGNQTRVTDDTGNETEFTVGAVSLPPCMEEVIAKDTLGNEYSCPSIQDAVDMAGEGWEIEVGSGSYDESISVKGKTGVTIISQCDAVVNGGFKLSRNIDVTIDGFIIDAGGAQNHGIMLKGSNNSNTDTIIRNCEIHGADTGYNGIFVARDNPNTLITDNYIHNNGRNGIMFISARGGPHFISNNTIEANGWNGVKVGRGHVVTLTGNTITGNGTNSTSTVERYGVRRGRGPHSGQPEGITLIDNIIKCNMGNIVKGKSSLDLGSYDQMLDAGDSGNCTTAGDEGPGVAQCSEGC
jgi:hypothetical protein